MYGEHTVRVVLNSTIRYKRYGLLVRTRQWRVDRDFEGWLPDNFKG